jgi:hypothetical protein
MKRIMISLALTLVTSVVANAQTAPVNTFVEQSAIPTTTQTVAIAPSAVGVPIVTSLVIVRTAPRFVVRPRPIVAVRPLVVRPAKRVVVHTHIVRR